MVTSTLLSENSFMPNLLNVGSCQRKLKMKNDEQTPSMYIPNITENLVQLRSYLVRETVLVVCLEQHKILCLAVHSSSFVI